MFQVSFCNYFNKDQRIFFTIFGSYNPINTPFTRRNFKHVYKMTSLKQGIVCFARVLIYRCTLANVRRAHVPRNQQIITFNVWNCTLYITQVKSEQMHRIYFYRIISNFYIFSPQYINIPILMNHMFYLRAELFMYYI